MNSSNKILSVAVVLLLLVNIGLVIFMFKGRRKPEQRKNREPFEMMAKELNMTEAQQINYKAQKEEHLKTIRPLFDSLRAAKTAFFSLVKDSSASDSLISQYSSKVTAQQATIDKLTFYHFRKVRSLFTADQQPKFDEFVKKMMDQNRKSKRDNHK